MAPRRVRSGEARTRQEERRAMVEDDDQQTRQYLVARFWEAALGFWRRGGGRTAWLLTLTVIAIALVNLGIQYRLNVWHRAMFDALGKRDGGEVLYQSMIFFPLIFASVSVAAAATYAKLTLQRGWREWLNAHVLDQWLTGGRYYQLNLVPGDHSNPENGESIAMLGGENEERAGLDAAFTTVRRRWRDLMMQYIRTTIVSQTSSGIAPIIPILLCAPKYVAGTMTLGEVMQAASAFLIVQVAFSWLVENYPRLADWTASASRLASLLVSLDRLERAEREGTTGRIVRKQAARGTPRLRGGFVTLDGGSAGGEES